MMDLALKDLTIGVYAILLIISAKIFISYFKEVINFKKYSKSFKNHSIDFLISLIGSFLTALLLMAFVELFTYPAYLYGPGVLFCKLSLFIHIGLYIYLIMIFTMGSVFGCRLNSFSGKAK